MRPISIIIVEDEAITALFMETMLVRKRYHVLKCLSSGEDAVDYVLKVNPDPVIMDIRFSGKINGVDAVKLIQEKAADAIKFIFTSGYSDHDMMERAMIMEPLAFMVKPVKLPELGRIIEHNFPDINKDFQVIR